MTRDEAKQILSLHRPWAGDAQSAEFAGALALCREDKELAAWYEEYRAGQEVLRSRFQKIPMPDGLKEQILSEHKSQKIVRLTSRPVPLYAAAACVALMCVLAALWFTRQPVSKEDITFNGYRNRMVRMATRAYVMDVETSDAVRIRSYLAGKKSPSDYVLPKALEQARQVGCGALSWQGKPVSMVCFQTGKPLAQGEKSDLFLFVIERASVADSPSQQEAPEFVKVSTLNTVTWTKDDKIYVLASPVDESFLKELL